MLECLLTGSQENKSVQKYVSNVTDHHSFTDFQLKTLASCDQFLALGGADGLIEIWNHEPNALAKLEYQNKQLFMVHEAPILSLDFSVSDSIEKLLLASGDSKGSIKVWKVLNGKCLRTIEVGLSEGQGGVTSLKFEGSTNLYAVCLDRTIKVFGLKSGGMIKQFKAHDSYI